MLNFPLFFKENRVSRVYTGGALLDDFTFGEKRGDGYFPEEWIASAVKALNKEPTRENEGISILENGKRFDEVLEENKYEMLGPDGKMRILVKFLDSAIRLPAQAHPDKNFSITHLGSEYGKTESWLILGKREGAKIFYGFKDGVDEEQFLGAIEASENDPDAMEKLMESYTPEIGDVFFVSAKTVHAIGYGCLILEVQEPTDFTIQPERWCGEYKLSDEEMYLGLPKQTALRCFDLSSKRGGRTAPKILKEDDHLRVEELIGEEQTPCFVINRISISQGEYTAYPAETYGVYIVTKGEGYIAGENYKRRIKSGDYFFMPYCAMGKFKIISEEKIQLVECY